jgi:hypothetical protein
MKMAEKDMATMPTISAGTGARFKRPIFIEQVSHFFFIHTRHRAKAGSRDEFYL